jgi:signal transduction histidine kinase
MLASRARATGELVPARWLDAGLVVGLLVLLAAGSVGPPAAGNPAPAALVLAVAQVAALWWRRAHPVAVVAVQLALSLVARVWLDAGGIASLAVLAGIYTVASLRGARLGIAAAAADLAVKLLAVAVTGARADSLPDHLALDALALVLGLYVRARRAHLGALREREARAAVEEERRRIARELHDVVAHHVSVMTLQAGGLEQRLRAGDQEASGAAAAIRRTGKEAMAELRRLLGVLRAGPDGGDRQPQPDLDRIEDLVARMRQAGLPVVLRRQGGRPVAAGVSLAAYRIVQEALTNTLRHAGPVATEVAVTVTDDAVQLRVANEGGEDGADNGLESAVGRRPSDSDRQDRRSAGLAGMRERVALLGGTIRAGPRPGGGWLVAAELPNPHPDGGREP